ncbi:SDR family NAD(P)-dependent oxidoreductase [Novosphingobium sp.]|uniref:SDR family NAD(P)-dependent oxidoreductase n=1 Tax=Novosphingobium sp. TaxID=1874826 RepID=UPI00286C25AE|nr:SDR family NAD(P)-dependent oxidoreductase [Novosphingobium sp.]
MSQTAIQSSAVVFGASGAIGGALTTRLLAQGTYSHVHAGSRAGDTAPDGAVPFRFALDDEASITAALNALAAPPTLVIVATGLLHDAAAGITPEKSWRALDPAAMAAVYAANAIGPALIAKHALPRLPRDRPATFAVLSAKVGSIGDNRLGGWHAYRASKAALNMLVRNFAIELARSHPLAVVAALHPGTVDSGLSAPFQRGVAAAALFSPDQAAGHLFDVIAALGPADSGGLFAWNGARLAW